MSYFFYHECAFMIRINIAPRFFEWRMFTSIGELNRIFYRYDDGTIASVVECNRWLLTELVLAASSSDYWLSKHALRIISIGVDTIETDDVPYLELLTANDWSRLLGGPHSEYFPAQHIDHIHGWPLDLLTLSLEDSTSVLVYLSTWVNSKDAIMSLGRRHPEAILEATPLFDVTIWQYLVQLSVGSYLVTNSLGKYSPRDQKKIYAYLCAYGTHTHG